ncbi:MAG: hypothetical protein IIY46_06960, partial [Lachnospiraceae bacterium]|nr:hypothetical protein [Lachnospiraceae bacterium]
MKIKRALLCLILVLVMVMGFAPVSVMAEEPEETENGSGAAEEEILVEVKDGILQNGGLFLPKTRKSRGASSEEKIAEAAALLYNAAKNWDGEAASMRIDISNAALPVSDIRTAFTAFLNGNPDMFYVQNRYSYSIGGEDTVGSMVLFFNTSYTLSDVEAFRSAASQILSGVDGSWSDEQKALYIHDYLVTHCEYDLTYTNRSAFDAIVTGRAVCQGYALAYNCLMNKCGVECDVITSQGINHAWNMITIGSGRYYVDCTWDDPTTGGGSTWYQDHCRHINFLRSTEGLTSTGHDSTDWLGSNGESVYEIETGTAYEDAWWNDCRTAIPHVGSKWAYFSYGDRYVHIHDYANGMDTVQFSPNGRWPVWGGSGSFYSGFEHLAADGEYFYVSTGNTICRFLPDGDPEEVYSLSDEELTRGYIYGIRTEGNKLYYRLYTSYDAATFAGEGFIVLFPAPDPVVIMSQPADQEVLRDEVAVFTVEAEGSIASYQWQYKIKGRTKWYNCTTSMIGYDTPELHVAATLSRDGFQYRCVITGENGEEVISDAAHLTVIANAIVITSQPADQEVTEGDTAHFTVAAEGEGLTYQWQYKIAGRTKWYNSSASTTGYNSAELQVAATLTRNGYEYRCVITDAANHEIISDAATLIVVEAPPFGIISQPQSVSITEGEIAHFTVEAEGENLTYKWQYRIAGSTKWRNSSSSTAGYNTAELQVAATLARNGYQYRCIVTCG